MGDEIRLPFASDIKGFLTEVRSSQIPVRKPASAWPALEAAAPAEELLKALFSPLLGATGGALDFRDEDSMQARTQRNVTIKTLLDVVMTRTQRRKQSAIGRYQMLKGGLQGLTEAWPTDLATAAHALADANGGDEGSKTAHLYLSGNGSSALPTHVDTFPVAVLALYGSKKWLVCEPAKSDWEVFRHRCNEITDADMQANNCREVVLNPGDLLYLPLDAVHMARAGDEGSAHITYMHSLPTWRNSPSTSMIWKMCCMAVPAKIIKVFSKFFIAGLLGA